jgi:hypothetical protein
MHLLSGRGSHTLTQTLSSAVGVGGDCTRVLGNVGENGFQDRQVYGLSAAEAGELEPDDEDGLEGEVPGEVVQNYTEQEALSEVEEPKYDPICEPLDVILVSGGLERLKREECRESPSNEVGHGASEGVDKVEKSEEDDTTKNKVCFGHLGALFKLVEDGVFRELLIKLVNVVAGLVRCLDVGRVFLDFLRCGHD